MIEPRLGWQPIRLRELWAYRELLWFLALRDVKVRYKQTALGAAWAIIQPLFTVLLFSVFFGKLGGLDKYYPDVPYALATFCALLPWQLFANALTNAGNSLVGSQNLITKVYFPRLTIPIAAALVGLVDFFISALILAGLMVYYHFAVGVTPTWAILSLPLFVLLAMLAALAAGLWLSALNVRYRDVRYAIPFLVQCWMYLSPVAYPTRIVPEAWRTWYGLNPIAGVIEGFRWALLGTAPPPGPMVLVSVLATLALLVGGLFYFRRMETEFADIV